MALVRLIYASKKADGLEIPDILRILDTAQVANEKFGITGILCFNETVFLQALEGDLFCVNQLYNKIINDKRHKNVCLIDFSLVVEREFADWSMGNVDVENLSTKAISSGVRNALRKERFDPYSMDAIRVLWLLKELSKTLNR